MPYLRLDSAQDSFNLDDVARTGYGIQATTGLTGFGLPPVATQWLEGAGDGGTFRGRRVQPRDIDLPFYICGRDRTDLTRLLSRLAVALAGQCTLRLVEDDGTDWSTVVHRVGGGDYTYGVDTTGETDIRLVVTVRAPDPYFTYSRPTVKHIANAGAGRGLLRGGLTRMRVASSETFGGIILENPGDAPAYPVWEVRGPGENFFAWMTPPGGSSVEFGWLGRLERGQTLTVDTFTGTVTDQDGRNRYDLMYQAPKFWSIPPGTTEATAELFATDPDSIITCSWRPRRWFLI